METEENTVAITATPQRTFYCRRQFQIDRPGGKSRGTKRKNRVVSLRTLL